MSQISAKQVSGLRVLATSQPVFYVNPTTGSDSNNGLAVGTAFATLQKAIDVLTTIDCNGFDPIINLASGNHDGLLTLKNVIGVANRVTIQGINGDRAACKIRGTTTTAGGHSVVASSATPYRFKDVEIGINNNTADLYRKLILVQCPLLEFEDVCLRGATPTDDFISAYSRSTIQFIGSLQIEGSARWFLDVNGGFVYFTDNFAFSGNSTFTVFAHGSDFTAVCYASTIAGTHTGKRFEIVDGVLETYGAGDGLPGSAAGTNVYPGLSGGNTDLSIANRTSTTLDILSSSGAPTTLPAATTSLAGLLTGADKTKLNNAIESTQLGANNGVAQLGATGKHLPGQTLPNSVTYNASTGVLAFTWADGATQNIDLPVENLFQNASYNSETQTLTLTTNGGGTLDISLAALVDLPEVVIAQSDPATTPTTGQKLYLRSDTGEYWIAASGAWQGKYLAFTSAERTKLAGVQTGAINQTTADGRYRLQSDSIPASEITGTFQESQIPPSVARDTEVAAAVVAHESASDPHPGYRLVSELVPTSDVADLAEFVRDTIGATLVQGSNVTITPDDPGNTITISATGVSGGGFTPVVAEYETPGTSALFQAPAGATRLYVRAIAAGGGGGSGRRGAAGTTRGGGAGGHGGGWSEATLILAGLAAQLGTTVDNLRFSAVVQAGGTGGAAVTTDDTNGNAGVSPSGETILRVQAGTGGSPVNICRASSQGGGNGGTTSGGTVGFTFTANASNTMAMFAANAATPGGTGGSTFGFLAGWASAIVGGSGGQGINSSNVGASAISTAGAGMSAMGGSAVPNTTAGNNAVAHGIPLLSGAPGLGGASNGTVSANGTNGYRGSGGGGGAASVNGTPSGAGGNGGNGYVGILWM